MNLNRIIALLGNVPRLYTTDAGAIEYNSQFSQRNTHISHKAIRKGLRDFTILNSENERGCSHLRAG